ncbi:Uncharacterized protein dnl_17030 [Desulfonema limicola]|uniref:Uncharacterized protein n=1 Tax=Desulfonema limicola TaxID=45656 RepID=A0A975B5Y6_9BACT|nr:hypothetical protein [Desulfonema limicola]QTA79433.1 Uncharacterized protein dnl_17030 [Desulfonema limicola]
MPDTFNTESKILIRSQWSKKLIKFINKKLNSKLVYLGLPSPDAEDILEWVDYIDEVIAFQCRDYPNPSDPSQSIDDIQKLQNKLSELERKRIINNFVVYDGYIEEVILNKKDNAGIKFEINNIVHIFNLDFCNSITSPLSVVDENGDVKEVYKFDAIKTLLQLQGLLEANPKRFVLFLTIHKSYEGKELKNFNDTLSYPQYRKLEKKEKRARYLRSYVIETLKNFFQYHDFVPEFLPVIEYEGVNKHQLLHFTVLGASKKEKTGTAPFFQNIPDILKQKFITIENNQFVNKKTNNINEVDVEINPVNIFSSSKAFKLLWATN